MVFKLILTYNYWQDRYEVDGYENIPLSKYMIYMIKLAIMFLINVTTFCLLKSFDFSLDQFEPNLVSSLKPLLSLIIFIQYFGLMI